MYTIWKNEEGNEYPTFSILTTESNDLLSRIHNVGQRMPLIIPAKKREHWLFAKDKQEINALIVPYEGELKSHRTVEVTKIRGKDTNIAEIQKEIR